MPISHWKNTSLDLARASALCLVFLLLSTPVRAAEAGGVVAGRDAHAQQELAVAAESNRRAIDGAVLFLRGTDGRLYAPADQLDNWRLQPPRSDALRHHGRLYVALDAISGLTYKLNEAAQAIVIQAPAGAFLTTRLVEQQRS